MEPRSPVLPGYNVPEIKFAENQPEFQTLPAVRTHDGLVLSRWEPTPAELQALKDGAASLFLFVWITACARCGEAQPLTPILPEITTAKEIMERSAQQRGVPLPSASGNGNGKAQLELPAGTNPTETTPPSDEDIASVFQQLWTSQVGQPGYRERRWKNLRDLLKRRGITV